MKIVPKEASISSCPVLIIEDSNSIAMLIEEFLNSLGYYDIRISNSGKDGMQVFESLIKAEMQPIVFLDYNLPDVDANVVLPNLLSKRHDTKIIIATALEKTDQEVKNVIMNGAYLYVQKPIRFNDVQRVIKILEEEARAAIRENHEAKERIDSLLGTSFVTLNKISELCNIKKEKAMMYLKEQESQRKVLCSDNVEEVSCNRCGSVLLEKANELETNNDTYHCLRCNNVFSSKDARKIVTKGYRARLCVSLKNNESFRLA